MTDAPLPTAGGSYVYDDATGTLLPVSTPETLPVALPFETEQTPIPTPEGDDTETPAEED
jgi:hypothetical protein